MIVLDTSIFVDSLIPFDKVRHKLCVSLVNLISERGFNVYEPKLLAVCCLSSI